MTRIEPRPQPAAPRVRCIAPTWRGSRISAVAAVAVLGVFGCQASDGEGNAPLGSTSASAGPVPTLPPTPNSGGVGGNGPGNPPNGVAGDTSGPDDDVADDDSPADDTAPDDEPVSDDDVPVDDDVADDDSAADDSSDDTADDDVVDDDSAGDDDVPPDDDTSADDDTGADDDTDPTLVDCVFDVSSELSPEIATVGIVEWSVDLSSLTSASIEFGRDTSYGLTAPVDLEEQNYRTLLLGMTASSDYHFRIVAVAGDSECVSEDYSITTGPPRNDFPAPNVNTPRPEEVEEGFIVTSRFVGGGGGGGEGQVYILNHEGQLVWWYPAPISQISRARLSYDGKYLYARDVNVQGGPGAFAKISMDGLSEEMISLDTGHHDFTVTPDGGVTFIRKASGDTCDEIARLEPDGSINLLHTVMDAYPPGSVQGGGELCHVNSIHYHETDESYTYSDLNQNLYVKIDSAGQVQWVLGGGEQFSDFSGDGADWNRQHGHHLLGPDRLLFFNNGGLGGGSTSIAIEVLLDLDNMTAEEVWSYDGDNSSMTLGDVQRLPNGNTLITYSNGGVMHEVNRDGQLVQEMTWPLGGATGYANHRPNLYGKPPR